MSVSRARNRVLSNVFYYLRIWYRTFPVGILFLVISVPLTILSIYCQIRIPQLLIRGIERGDSVHATLLSIVYAFLIMTACKMLMEVCQTKLRTRGSRPMMWLYSVPVHDKIFNALPATHSCRCSESDCCLRLCNTWRRRPIHFFDSGYPAS